MASTKPSQQFFPCPSCGAKLEFNPSLSQLACPYCGHQAERKTVTPGIVQEREFNQFVNANRTQIAALSTTAQEVECPGCRAQITFQPPDVAAKCPFCATSIVAQPHSANPMIMPEALLPFELAKKAAIAKMKHWISHGNWFAPNGLKKLAQFEQMHGIYLPFWTYDSQTYSQYRGERGEYYHTEETYTVTNSEGKRETKTRSVRHTRWHPKSGQVQRFFDDVLVPAITSEVINAERLDRLEPWNLRKLVPYESSYLAGFKAQRYQVDLNAGLGKAKKKMTSTIRSDIQRDIGGDEQRIHSVSTDYRQITFKHLLLPVWMCAYRFNNKTYQVMINAQTGEVLGDRPVSPWKVAFAVATVIVAIAGFIIGKNHFERSRPAPQQQPTSIEIPSTTPPATPPTSANVVASITTVSLR